MKRVLALLCIVICASACDPGMHYSIPGAKTVRANGVRYVADIGDGIEARFYASAFTIHGHSEVQVLNNSAATVDFEPTPTLIVAGNGARVPVRCQLPDQQKVSIRKGESVTVVCGFEARLRRFSYEPEFETLTLSQPGFSSDGKPLDVVASMRGS